VAREGLLCRKRAVRGEWGSISIVEVRVRPPEVFVRPPLHEESRDRAVSARHLGVLLAEAGPSFQRTHTWKASPDPDDEAKTARILALCATPPPGGIVISFDQMGPVSLRPTAGAARRH
jgi:hypothetical protein